MIRFALFFSLVAFGLTPLIAQQNQESASSDDSYLVTYYWAYHEGGSGPDGLEATKISTPDTDKQKAIDALAAWRKANKNTLLVSGIGDKTERVPNNRVGRDRIPTPTDPLSGPKAKLIPDNPKSEAEKEYEKALEAERRAFEEAFNRLNRAPLITQWDEINSEIDRVERKAQSEGKPITGEDDPRITALLEQIARFDRSRQKDQREADDLLSLARKLGMVSSNSPGSTTGGAAIDRETLDAKLTGPWKSAPGSLLIRNEIFIISARGTVEVSSGGGTGNSYYSVKSPMPSNGRFQFRMKEGFANEQGEITGEGWLEGENLHMIMRRRGEVREGLMIREKR